MKVSKKRQTVELPHSIERGYLKINGKEIQLGSLSLYKKRDSESASIRRSGTKNRSRIAINRKRERVTSFFIIVVVSEFFM